MQRADRLRSTTGIRLQQDVQTCGCSEVGLLVDNASSDRYHTTYFVDVQQWHEANCGFRYAESSRFHGAPSLFCDEHIHTVRAVSAAMTLQKNLI
jgi:hypothetical protein